MELYYYCSWDKHPGKVGRVSKKDGLHVTSEGLNPFIENCFQTRNVSASCGVVPNQPAKYYLQTPPLVVDGDQRKHGAARFYLQIGVITADSKEFQKYMRRGNTQQQIAAAIRDSIKVTDPQNKDYQYDLVQKGIKNLLSANFGNLFPELDLQSALKMTCIYTGKDLPDADIKEIVNRLGVDGKLSKMKANGWLSFQSGDTSQENKRFAALTKTIPVNQVLAGRVV